MIVFTRNYKLENSNIVTRPLVSEIDDGFVITNEYVKILQLQFLS
jgi:hypothetical protein